jgi:nicotinamide-nucleotide adenylyltransferase
VTSGLVLATQELGSITGRGTSSRMRRGMIHGRFQPFHRGHLEYMRGAAERCDELWVGITNPDPARVKPETSDPARHLPESNPFSYGERLLMVKAAAGDLGLDPERVHVIPFPVNEPELWTAYVPVGVTQFLRLFSAWGGEKLERLRDAGYEVVVLDEGTEKEISGVQVREALRSGAEWEPLVPPGVARVLRELERVAV